MGVFEQPKLNHIRNNTANDQEQYNRTMCLNNSALVYDSDKNNYVCLCDDGYEGEFCEKEIVEYDEQELITATINVSMAEGVDIHIDYPSYHEPYDDYNSVEDVDLINRCKNGGEYVQDNESGSYKCICDYAYDGEFCENEIDLTYDDDDYNYDYNHEVTTAILMADK